MNRFAVPFLALVATTAAYAQPKPACQTSNPTLHCGSGTCHVQVELIGGQLFVTPQVVTISNGTGSKQIHWDAGAGGKFDDNHGITFKTATSQISQAGPIAAGKSYKVKFANTVGGNYPYTVSVLFNGTAYECDPAINNQGGEEPKRSAQPVKKAPAK